MLESFRKTLTKVIHLRSIIGYNGLVYALKKTPLIGKLLPDKLYSTTALKVIYWVFHIIKEAFLLFLGKIFGLGMIYLISLLLKTEYMAFGMERGISEGHLYADFALLFFIIYALFGIVIRKPYFKCTTEKEYLVFMLRMDPAKLNITLFVYDLAKLVIGYLIAGIVAIIAGAPIWLWLGIPVLAVFIKFIGIGAQAFSFRLKHKRNKPMKENATVYVLKVSALAIVFPFVFIMIVNGNFVDLPILLAIAALLVLLGTLGFFELKRFNSNLHRRALNDNIVKTEITMYKEPDNTRQFKKIKAKGTVSSNKKGFEYLNALFVKRHFGMLMVKPIVFAAGTLLILGMFIAGFISSYYNRMGSDACIDMVLKSLGNLLLFKGFPEELYLTEDETANTFFRYLVQYHLLALIVPITIADNSFKSTQAMYINCDNSLMTFSFFKQRDKIIRLFDIRLKQLFKINIAPAVVFAMIANLVLFYTGGQDYPFQYLVTFVIAIAISMFCSMFWLAMYYLFQPFTTSVNIKSGVYNVVRFIIFTVLAIIVWIPSHSLVLAAILVVFTALFIFSMRKLVYKKAPKTWKIKT